MAKASTQFNTEPKCSACGKDIAISIGSGKCTSCMTPSWLKGFFEKYW